MPLLTIAHIGRTWSPLKPPATVLNGDKIPCNPDDEKCSLHLHSVTLPHNFGRVFSSPAPGFVMGIGSIGEHLLPYDECDTFLSNDGGITWEMVRQDAQKYEFGDQGSILVTVNDEEGVDYVNYSTDFGKTWCVCIVANLSSIISKPSGCSGRRTTSRPASVPAS